MSEQLAEFHKWVKDYLPRGYSPPKRTKILLESGLKDMPRDLIEQSKANRNNLIYLHGFQTYLLGLFALSKADINTCLSILQIRSLQFARGLNLKALHTEPEKVMKNPSKYFHAEQLRWGWTLSNVRGRPGDRLKFLLLLTPYRKLIEEETDRRLQNWKAGQPKKAPLEAERTEANERRKLVAQVRNSVHRAWTKMKLPEEIVALLLVVQFYVWKNSPEMEY